ncbi:hypothetical protein EJP82_15305 [Paenibacillus anaericanus]|uniref:Uncharacterized protein n=1 Tax=Paenibacillus anaericanus TaxID=170367 RepID=A0A433Y7S4_9BACL|nr:hypothetical protein EJP82_15305 [Paenibacillus anaericanus]
MPLWQYMVSMVVYIGLLMLIVGYMREHVKFANVFWIGSLVTFPMWIMGGVVGWFRWSKILSVIFPTIFVGFSRLANADSLAGKFKGKFWDSLRKEWVLWILYGVLFLNIAEATIKDFTLGNIFNAACGFLLCVTIPFPLKRNFWKLAGKNGELLVYTTIAWNFLYTTWNACFVYGESPVYFASSVCILLAAELYPVLKGRPELYVIARVYTLATHLIIRACFPNLFPALMDSSSWYNAGVLKYWGIINFVLIVPYVFWHMYQLHTGKANISFRRGKVDNTAIEAA